MEFLDVYCSHDTKEKPYEKVRFSTFREEFLLTVFHAEGFVQNRFFMKRDEVIALTNFLLQKLQETA